MFLYFVFVLLQRTPLHYAAFCGLLSVAAFLIAHVPPGVRTDSVNNQNMTALQVARTQHHLGVVRLLEGEVRLNEWACVRSAGYLSFHPMAQCVVHALIGLAYHAWSSRTR